MPAFRPVLAALAVTAALAAVGCGSSDDASTSTSTSTTTAAQASPHVTLRVAQQVSSLQTIMEASGQLAGTPYKVEWSNFPAAATQLQALAGGAADIGLTGGAPLISALSANAPLKIGAATDTLAQNGDGTAILVKKNSNIHSVADLRGKTVSVDLQGSNGHYLLLKALQQAGLKPSDVKIVFLAPAQSRAAFANGSIDAWSTGDPSVAFAQLDDGARIVRNGQGLLHRYGFIVATDTTLANSAKRAAAADFVARYARATDWVAQHPQQWATTYARLYQTPVPVAKLIASRSGSHSVPLDAALQRNLQEIADTYEELGVSKHHVDVSGAFSDALQGK